MTSGMNVRYASLLYRAKINHCNSPGYQRKTTENIIHPVNAKNVFDKIQYLSMTEIFRS